MLKSFVKKTAVLPLCAAAIGLSAPSHSSAEPFLGQISAFGFNFAPRGWAFCSGQLLPISQNTALFALLGTTYGGDGRTTFGLPDLRGRVAIGFGAGPGLSNYSLGQRGGSEMVTLSVSNLPSHSHSATSVATVGASSGRGNTSSPDGAVAAVKPRTDIYSTAAPNVTMQPGAVTVDTTVGNTGGGQGFSVRDPYLTINYSIALQGIFPSRN